MQALQGQQIQNPNPKAKQKSQKNLLSYEKYAEGFVNGWNDGYLFQCNNLCVPPVAPLTPVPANGYYTYGYGYNIGFSWGIEQRKIDNDEW